MSEQHDEYELLARFYERMPAQRQREFWALRTGRADKMAYLFRWGGFALNGGRVA